MIKGRPFGATRTGSAVLACMVAALIASLLIVPSGPAGASGGPAGIPMSTGVASGFTDVPDVHPFVAEISWLASVGVTTGYADGTFHPTEAVSRQAMAAFLYRYAGRPPYIQPDTPRFSDVPINHPFYTEITWLADQGITTGYADGTFHPTEAVSRQAMAAFLYRYAHGSAFTPPGSATFSDVPTGAGFFTEVEWLASTGITTGYADHTFHPTEDVSRQAMAAFLYRYDTNPEIDQPPAVPAPVSDLRVVVQSTTALTLGWINPPVDGLTGVVVRRADGAVAPPSLDAGTLVVQTSRSVNEWSDTALTPGATYSYALFAQYADATQVPAATITVTVPTVASVSGTVLGAGAAAVPGVSVEITSADQTQSVRVVTGPDGTYEVAGLTAGTYAVCFVPAGVTTGAPTGYLPQCFDQIDAGDSPTPVAVTGVATTTGIDATLAVAGSVSGTVTDAGGAPLAGVIVGVELPGGQPVAFAVTDASGSWAIAGLEGGSYGVCFDPADVAGATTYTAQCYNNLPATTSPTPITVATGTAMTGIDATLPSVAALAADPAIAALIAAQAVATSNSIGTAATVSDEPAAAATVPGVVSSDDLSTVACADVLFLGARGSGQTGPGGGKTNPDDPNAGVGGEVLTAYTELKTSLGTRFTITPPIALAYRADSIRSIATLRFIHDLWQGVKVARLALQARATACPNERIVLAGFSQGAMLMRRVLTDAVTKRIDPISASMNPAILTRVDATILIADGDRVAHDTTRNYGTAKDTAEGVGTQTDITINPAKLSAAVGARTVSVCDVRDAVCDFRLPANNLLGVLDAGSDAYGIYVHTHHYNQSAIVRQAAAAAANLIRTVPPALTFVTATTLPGATVGVPYSVTFQATGGVPPYTYGLASSVPDNGLDTWANGTWFGTPTTPGTVSVTIQTTDRTGARATATFHLPIGQPGIRVTTLVSAAPDGSPANDRSDAPAVSADGRWITYASIASDLVEGDTNGAREVFVTDRTTGVTTLVSAAPDGTPANHDSYEPAVSADGRWITFASNASNLVAGDTNGEPDVFVTDRTTGVTTLVSAAPDGTPANSFSLLGVGPAVSTDGRWITFASNASNLVAGDTNGEPDVFVTDRTTGVTTLVSAAPDGSPANQRSSEPAMSADGRWITYVSSASNLVAGDGDAYWFSNVFVTDRTTGVTTLVSAAPDGTPDNANFDGPAVSADGRWITYSSDSSSLVADHGPFQHGWYDLYLTDRTTGVTTLVSAALDGTPANAGTEPAVSADGRWITYESYASNLVAGDTNGESDVFVTDRTTGVTTLVSAAPDGTPANAGSYDPAVSADGRWVTYVSWASNLVAGDTNGAGEVFVSLNPGMP